MLEANAVWTVYFQECSENNVYSPLYVPTGAFADVPHNIYLLFRTMYCTIIQENIWRMIFFMNSRNS